jgi:hypothetical protein
MTNNPFDLKNYKAKIDMSDLNTAAKNAHQQSAVVNKRRMEGVEPSVAYSSKGMDTEPKKFAISMPVMPKHDKAAGARARRERKKEGKNNG